MPKERILLAHGSGGQLSNNLIKEYFLSNFKNPFLEKLNDQAVFYIKSSKLAFTTDSYTVDPIFFPGSDIGELAVYGTVNDLAMSGATPLYLSVGIIIEEGFLIKDLERIIISMKKAAEEASVQIVTGDTKVVNKGCADKIFINTSGIGIISEDVDISGDKAEVGDKVIVSGFIGDHGIAVLSKREGIDFKTKILSDTAPLNFLVADMLKVSKEIHSLRDPTRGGLATTLNELANQSNVGIIIEEDSIPIKEEVRGACEILGLDPLYIANEGKLVAIVKANIAEQLVKRMRKNVYGKNAQIIGEVIEKPKKKVIMKTRIGGTRIVDMLVGEQLPRIC